MYKVKEIAESGTHIDDLIWVNTSKFSIGEGWSKGANKTTSEVWLFRFFLRGPNNI